MSKSERFPEPYNLASIKNQEYLQLFKDIIVFASVEFDIESADPILDVSADTRESHRTTNKLRKFDRQILHEFVNDIPNEDFIKFKTLLHKLGFEKRWKKAPNEGASKETIETAICASAQAQEIPLLNLIAQYLKYCERSEFPIEAIKGHEDTVKKLLKEVESRASSISSSQKSDTNLGGFHIRWKNDLCKIKPGKGISSLDIPNQSAARRLNNIATLLDWRYHLTPVLIGRDREIERLKEWLDSGPSIQLIYGEGGTGKTRLAFHFAKTMIDQGWEAGTTGIDLEGDWKTGSAGMLLIIDYPEERRNLVTQFVRALKDMPESTRKLRVLLLSRNRDLLETLTAEAPGLINPPLHLTGLNAEDDKWDLIKDAWDSLQKPDGALEKQKTPLPIDKDAFIDWQKKSTEYSTPLMIIALAVYLREIGDRANYSLLDLSTQKLIRYFSVREERLIRNEVENFIKNENIQDLETEGVLLIKAMSAITDGLDNQAIRLLVNDLAPHNLDYAPPQAKYLVKLSVCVDKQLPALKPDILAADFLVYCLEKFAENQESEWIFAAIGLTRLENSNVDNQQILDNFSKLGRLIYDAKIRLKRSWPIDALCLGIEDKPAYCLWIAAHLSKNNLEPHLKPLVIHALRICLNETLDPPKEAGFRMFLSVFLGNTGDNAGGLKAIEPAVEILEALAEENFAVYGPELAGSLNNLSIRLAATGDNAGGLKAIERAVKIREALAEENFAVYGPDLAQNLRNLSISLADTGDKAGGLKAIERAVKIREALAEENFAVYGPDLAQSLNNLSISLVDTGDKAGGLKAIERTVEIREALAEENFAVYGPELAQSLHNLSLRLTDTGDKAGELKAIERAVEILETLAEENFTVYGPDLAGSLNNLSISLADTGDKAGGLKAIKRTVEICEALAQENFAVYGPDLGSSLFLYCVEFKWHMPSLIRTKNIYLQVRDTCFDPWVANFPAILNGLLARAEEMHDQDAIQSIESILQEIRKTTGSND